MRPRASTLKVNAAIPLPFPAILVSQIFLKNSLDERNNLIMEKIIIIFSLFFGGIIPAVVLNRLRRDRSRDS